MTLLSLLSWNMQQQASNWKTVLESGADVAMLQETKPPHPQHVEQIDMDHGGDWLVPGQLWRSAVVGLSKRIKFTPIMSQPLGSGNPDALMASRPGTIAAAVVRILETEEELTIVSLYSTWEEPLRSTGSSWIYADASAHRLISDLSGLIGQQKNHRIIVSGDLNILHGYGEGNSPYWKGRYDTVFYRMSALGLCFVGPQAPGGGKQALPRPLELPADSCNVPTFRTQKSKPETATRQLDFVFASESIANRLSVRAANSSEDWGPSNHCRIFIDLGY